MNARVLLAAAVGLVGGVALSACIVDREGAPCTRDDNCPRSQYCDGTLPQHVCKELTPELTEAAACPLILESLSQQLSACLGGQSQPWADEIDIPKICATMAASVTAGRQTYEPMELKSCRAAILGATCSTLGSRAPGQQLLECDVYTGTVAASGTCTTTEDCVAGHWCNATTGCAGTCEAYVAVGNACSPTADLCAPGAACVNGTCLPLLTSGQCDAGVCNPFTHLCNGSGQCAPKGAVGAPGCDQNIAGGAGNLCQPNLNCVGALLGAKGCQAGAPVDTPCQPLTNTCERFTVCMARDGGNFCTNTPGAGAQCGAAAGAQDAVTCRESRCVLAFLSLQGTCSAFVAPGAACTAGPEEGAEGRNSQCGRHARCISGVCRSEFCP